MIRPARARIITEMCAGQVSPDHCFPVFQLHAHGEAVAGDGGVVDQDIELAEFFENLLKAGFDLFGVGDVDFYGQSFAARGSDFADEQGQLFFVARGYGHFRASFN